MITSCNHARVIGRLVTNYPACELASQYLPSIGLPLRNPPFCTRWPSTRPLTIGSNGSDFGVGGWISYPLSASFPSLGSWAVAVGYSTFLMEMPSGASVSLTPFWVDLMRITTPFLFFMTIEAPPPPNAPPA